jgi:hypothetical protein
VRLQADGDLVVACLQQVRERLFPNDGELRRATLLHKTKPLIPHVHQEMHPNHGVELKHHELH